jgi:hypothetical protein
MVFVDTDAIEAELFGVLELVQITVVKKVSLLRIVVPVGESYPGGRVFTLIVKVARRSGHGMR